MSKYKEWKRSTAVLVPDVERWDEKVSQEEFSTYALGWLQGGNVLGLNANLILKELQEKHLYLDAPQEFKVNSSIDIDYKFNIRTVPIAYESTGKALNEILNEQDISLLSSSGKRVLRSFFVRDLDKGKSGAYNILYLLLDMKKFIMSHYGELFTSSNPSWSTILRGMKENDISLILHLGGMYTRDTEEPERKLDDAYSGIEISALGSKERKVVIALTTQDDPKDKIYIDSDYLSEITTSEGYMKLTFSTKASDVSESQWKEKRKLNMDWVVTSPVGVEGKAEYSFYKTFVTREEFNHFIVGNDVTLKDTIKLGRELKYSVINGEGRVYFGKSPSRVLAYGTGLTPSGDRASKVEVAKVWDNPTSFDNYVTTGRKTSDFRKITTSLTPLEGSIDTNKTSGNNEISKYGIEMYSSALRPSGGSLGMNFQAKPSNYGVSMQGWDFDWVYFFDTYYKGILPSGYSREQKVKMIKEKIKPKMTLSFNDIKNSFTYSDYSSRNDKSFRPQEFKLNAFINKGDSLTKVGSTIVIPFPNEYDYDNAKGGSFGYIGDKYHNLEDIKIDYTNIDSEGYTYFGYATINIAQLDWRYKYNMQEENSPVIFNIEFNWGLTKSVTTITGGVTMKEIANLQEQIDKLKE